MNIINLEVGGSAEPPSGYSPVRSFRVFLLSTDHDYYMSHDTYVMTHNHVEKNWRACVHDQLEPGSPQERQTRYEASKAVARGGFHGSEEPPKT